MRKNGYAVLGTNPALVLTPKLLVVSSLSLLTLWTLILLGQKEPVFWISLTCLELSATAVFDLPWRKAMCLCSRGETRGLRAERRNEEVDRKSSGYVEKSFARIQPLLVLQQVHKCWSSNVMLWYSIEIAGLFVYVWCGFCFVFFLKNCFCQLQFVINL